MLMEAAFGGSAPLVRTLLELKADPRAKNREVRSFDQIDRVVSHERLKNQGSKLGETMPTKRANVRWRIINSKTAHLFLYSFHFVLLWYLLRLHFLSSLRFLRPSFSCSCFSAFSSCFSFFL